MSDAPATAAPVKTTKKRAGGASKPKKPATHPKYSEMITAALSALKVRSSLGRHHNRRLSTCGAKYCSI